MQQYKIAVVGAGSAGFTAAAAIKKHNPDISVEVLHDPALPSIGVGESLGFYARHFITEILGLDESAWMNKANANYKHGVVFRNWNDVDKYFYLGHRNLNIRDFGLCTALHSGLKTGKITKDDLFDDKTNKLHDTSWGANIPTYQLDAGLIGQVIHDLVGKPAGVIEKPIAVRKAVVTNSDRIDHLILDDGSTYTADLYIDCTGFKRLLASELSFKNIDLGEYYNNSAIVGMHRYNDPAEAVKWTTHDALDYGWAFCVSLTHRSGNGYAYNSRFVSDESKLIDEFERKLGKKGVLSRKITWTPGYLEKAIVGNCVVLGLGNGFIDPFDASGFTKTMKLISVVTNGLKSDTERDLSWGADLNQFVTNAVESIKLRIDSGFHLAKKNNTDYWCMQKEAAKKFNTLSRLTEFLNDPIAGTQMYNHSSKVDHFKMCLYNDIILDAGPVNPAAADIAASLFKSRN